MIKASFTLQLSAQEFMRRLDSAINHWDDRSERLSRRYADEIVTKVRTGVFRQSFKLAALNPRYKARKISAGRDPRILISTQTYLDNIKVVRLHHAMYGVECDQILRDRLEFGTKTQPARPHWQPAIEDWMQDKKSILEGVSNVLLGR